MSREDLTAAELALCRKDRRWLFERHFVIHNKQGRLQLMSPLRLAQRKALAVIEYFRQRNEPVRLIIGKARKQGLSTVIEADGLTEVVEKDINMMVIAHDKELAEKILDITHRFYRYMDQAFDKAIPPITKPPLFKGQSSKHEIRFDDREGRIWIGTANNVYAGTGLTPQYLHCTEMSKWDRGAQTAISLFQSVATLPNTSIVVECTFNGNDPLFLPYWTAAWENSRLTFTEEEGRLVPRFEVTNHQKWNHFVPLFISILDDEEAHLNFHDEDDRSRFALTLDPYETLMIERMGASLEYLNWRRMTLKLTCQNKVEIYKQEYPACVTAETRVSTELGIIPICEAGGAVSTESGPILAHGVQIPSPIYRLATVCGRVLRGTHDHPVCVEGDHFVHLSKLRKGDPLVLRQPRFADDPYRQTWHPIPGIAATMQIDADWAGLIGYFVGDGCWYKDTISIVCDAKDQDVVAHVEELLTRLIGPPSIRQVRGATDLRIGRQQARPAFIELGLLHKLTPDASWTRKVCVPECIFRSPKDIVARFLSTLFEADGSASAGKVRFGSSKPEFVRDVQQLLLGFGINGRIGERVKWASSGKYRYIFYALDLGIEGSRAFHESIGFIGARKRALCPPERRRGKPVWHMTDEVLGVTRDGFEETWDLTVEKDHVFSANGILTHNTPEEAVQSSGKARFKTDAIQAIQMCYQEDGERGELYRGDTWDRRIHWRKDSGGIMLRFRDRIPGHRYVIGCDVAEGKLDKNEEERDATVATVHDCDLSMEQVAVIYGLISEENIIDPLLLLGEYYNRAFICVESNSTGKHTCIELSKRYPRECLYHRDDFDERSRMSREVGFRTHIGTKPLLIGTLAEAVESQTIVIHCQQSFKELLYYVYKPGGGTEADAGHDDHVMALGLAMMASRARPFLRQQRREMLPIEKLYQRPRPMKALPQTRSVTGY